MQFLFSIINWINVFRRGNLSRTCSKRQRSKRQIKMRQRSLVGSGRHVVTTVLVFTSHYRPVQKGCPKKIPDLLAVSAYNWAMKIKHANHTKSLPSSYTFTTRGEDSPDYKIIKISHTDDGQWRMWPPSCAGWITWQDLVFASSHYQRRHVFIILTLLCNKWFEEMNILCIEIRGFVQLNVRALLTKKLFWIIVFKDVMFNNSKRKQVLSIKSDGECWKKIYSSNSNQVIPIMDIL